MMSVLQLTAVGYPQIPGHCNKVFLILFFFFQWRHKVETLLQTDEVEGQRLEKSGEGWGKAWQVIVGDVRNSADRFLF